MTVADAEDSSGRQQIAGRGLAVAAAVAFIVRVIPTGQTRW